MGCTMMAMVAHLSSIGNNLNVKRCLELLGNGATLCELLRPRLNRTGHQVNCLHIPCVSWKPHETRPQTER